MEEGNAPTLERKAAQMQAILPILEFIQSILTKPAWIMGLFAFVGLVALKRPAHKVMTGTLKPILGYIMLSAGAAVVQENLAPLGTFIETGFPSFPARMSRFKSRMGFEKLHWKPTARNLPVLSEVSCSVTASCTVGQSGFSTRTFEPCSIAQTDCGRCSGIGVEISARSALFSA